MATAAAATADAHASDDASPKKKSKKKLFIILGVVLALVLVGGGGAVFMMKKRAAAAAAAADASGDASAEPAPDEHDAHAAPTFVPLDQFTVNLADRDQDRFAQVGLVLEVDDPKVGEDIKNYLPSIRNAILLLLSHKSSQELMEPEGKERLAEEVRVAAAQAMGLKVSPPVFAASGASAGSHGKTKAKKPKDENPIVRVNYSSFIIQ